jgi:hypothetical protein
VAGGKSGQYRLPAAMAVGIVDGDGPGGHRHDGPGGRRSGMIGCHPSASRPGRRVDLPAVDRPSPVSCRSGTSDYWKLTLLGLPVITCASA